MTPLINSTPTRHSFFPLTVVSKEELTDTSVAIGLRPRAEDAESFAFEAGQHLTLRAELDDTEVRRSYSICDSPTDVAASGVLRCGVSVVPGGAMSTYINEHVEVGDTIEAMPPQGSFTTTFDPTARRHHVAIAAGSGITPILALVRTALQTEPNSEVTLIFGNRYVTTVMFLEEIADLKNRYPERLNVVHMLSREGQDSDVLGGRMDAPKLNALLDHVQPGGSADAYYLCGPHGLVTTTQEVLGERGVPSEHIHHEIFHVDDASAPAPPVLEDVESEATVTVTLDGRTTVVNMPSRTESILAATLRQRPDAPFSCTGGVCGTCRARVTSGEVTMARNFALEPDEVERGIVLACQSFPVTDEVALDYDA